MTTAWPEPAPTIRRMGSYRKACRGCGWRFFTVGGLRDHEAHCLAQAGRRVAGRAKAAVNNTYSRRCDDCGRLSTPAGLGMHQKHTGHTGWTPT